MPKAKTFRVKRGFTVAEALLSAVILVIAAAGVLLPYTSGAMIRVEGRRQTLASKLASDLMEEVKNEEFGDIVANYNYTEAAGSVKDATGTVFSGSMYDGFSREVRSVYKPVDQEKWWSEDKYILATVTVYYEGNEMVSVRRLITR